MNEEQRTFSKVDKLLCVEKFPDAIKIMHSWPKVRLNKFYEEYPLHYELLKQDDFAEFWSKRRSELPKYDFQAQPNVPDIDFVLGYVFYLLALNAENKHCQEDFIKYLHLALKFDSIHAAQTFFHKILMSETNDIAKKTENLAAILLHWEHLGNKHGTPGYLLLANGYLHLVFIYRNKLKSMKIDSLASKSLWKNLVLAQWSELDSKSSIHNAFFGNGLRVSNAAKLTTISDMKSAARKLIADENIIIFAENDVRSILNQKNRTIAKKD